MSGVEIFILVALVLVGRILDELATQIVDTLSESILTVDVLVLIVVAVISVVVIPAFDIDIVVLDTFVL